MRRKQKVNSKWHQSIHRPSVRF